MRKRQKKKTEAIKMRTFILEYTGGGKDTIEAETVAQANVQAADFLSLRGMHPKRDRKDFYEVKA